MSVEERLRETAKLIEALLFKISKLGFIGMVIFGIIAILDSLIWHMVFWYVWPIQIICAVIFLRASVVKRDLSKATRYERYWINRIMHRQELKRMKKEKKDE